MSHNDLSSPLLGRDSLLTSLWGELELRSFLLVGPRRIGKTALLKQMVRSPPCSWLAVRVDVEGFSSVEDVIDAVEGALHDRGLLRETAQRALARVEELSIAGAGVKLSSSNVPVAPWRHLEVVLRRALSNLPDDCRLLLALDEVPWWLDALQEHKDAQSARSALANLRRIRQQEGIGPRLRMVLTGSIGLAGLARSLNASAELNDLQPEIEVPPLSRSAGAALFEAEVAIRRGDVSTAVSLVAHELAGGSPHWIKALAVKSAARIGGMGHEVDRSMLDAAVAELLHPRMRDQFDDEGRSHLIRRHGEPNARKMVWILDAACQRPVAEHALISATMVDVDSPEPRAVRELIYTLVDEYYLTIDMIQGRALYRFVNPLFQRWWQRYGGVV